ncbi:MAG: DUF2231 domain-containing protein [Pseudomonadota bacterium]
MAETEFRRHRLHPIHAVILASALPLFLGALLSDWAYSSTEVVQYVNFASWLIAGALVFAGFALVWAAIERLRTDLPSHRTGTMYLLILAATFVLGFINALVHAKDAWAVMPAGLILSFVVFILALAAVWIGFSTFRSGDAQ